MAFLRRERAYIPAEVVANPSILGGEPCVSGTRVPAMTIVAELREGRKDSAIFVDYPSLPFDGIDAVRLWAKKNAVSLKSAR
jgi:uncharacterized protein (DUF433 family)